MYGEVSQEQPVAELFVENTPSDASAVVIPSVVTTPTQQAIVGK